MHQHDRSIPHISNSSESGEADYLKWKTSWDYRKRFKDNRLQSLRDHLCEFIPRTDLDKNLLLGVLPP